MAKEISTQKQDGNRSEDERPSVKASKKQFSFDEEFDVFLKELAKASDGKEDVSVVSSRLITFHDLKNKGAKDGYSLRTLPLSKLSSRFRNGFFCLRSMDMARVDSSMSLKDYKDRESQSDNGEKRHPSMNVYWTRGFQGDLKKTLKDISEPEKLPKDDEKPIEPDTLSDYQSALTTEQSIGMEKLKEKYSLYGLSRDDWSHVIEGNQLLYAFQVDVDLANRLQALSLQDFLEAEPKKAAPASNNEPQANDPNQPVDPRTISPNFSIMSTVNPVVPISRSTRPVFIINPDSGIGSSEKDEPESTKVHAGLFWSSPNILSSTKIMKVEDTLQQWSLQSGMSSKSFEAGLSIPIGKASVGTKFGFEREQSNRDERENKVKGSSLTALHLITTAQVNINETTVLLSPDAQTDIKRLRQKRRFSDLYTFLVKYGTQVYQTVTLGGQLYHAQSLSSTDTQHEQEQTNTVKKSMNASLGIPDLVEVTTGYSQQDSNKMVEGNREVHTTENLAWSGIGGNPTLIVDPPKWRESLNEYTNWRPIRYETPVRIDTFIGRIQGYSDVPVLFAEILSTGVLNRSIIALPPTGLKNGETTFQYSAPTPGMIINATTGTTLPILTTLSTIPEEVTPGGYSWAVYTEERRVQQEIRASLQSTLNLVVNINYHAPYLKGLHADTNSFSIVLKWTSSSVRESWKLDVQPDTEESTKVKDDLKDSVPKLEEVKKRQNDATTAWEQTKLNLEKEKTSWPTWKKGTPEEKQKAEEQEKALKDAEEKRAIEKSEIDQDLAQHTEKVTYAKVLGLVTADETDSKQFVLRNISSEAWIMGLWTICRKPSNAAPSNSSGNNKLKPLSTEDFEDLKSAFVQRFSGPQDIEGGCDFISDVLRNQLDVDVKFSMFASDGVARQETEVHSNIDPKYAFDFIDRRISLSSIHYLAVTGEIVPATGCQLLPAGYSSEAILLQYQEALARLIFLETRYKKDEVYKNIEDLKKKLEDIDTKQVGEAQTSLTDLFKEIYKLEV
ncbi:hypothetical protein AU210_011075 [Fusarium oxysporum f. sp. radicis-cucumerinum]|uniref:MACPF domain-containing protein n=1 Tax=Fusarium oxysporum f. sp. radicis-cucumerinum TaxID=327505 RepID=A0A2H3GLL3_FUSOX|nr:hypothetical protein AU210_011075 [Fusarium oxysporum f. sp. radicis-cucumerinum]